MNAQTRGPASSEAPLNLLSERGGHASKRRPSSLSARCSSILVLMQDARRAAKTVTETLSAARMSTYMEAAGDDTALALDLYVWNARISSALMIPSHFAEVSTRNAADEALTDKYGPDWPWNASFERSLPHGPPRKYSPNTDLVSTRQSLDSTGKVIAELKFAFWENLFTSRHDKRLWKSHRNDLFPAATADAAELRNRIRQDLEDIRRLRNRIAHHEPIFTRDLASSLNKMKELIRLRSDETAVLVGSIEEATLLLATRPAGTTPVP